MAQREGFLCDDGYRAVMLALRASHSALSQSRFAAKPFTGRFCGRSVESLYYNKKPSHVDGFSGAERGIRTLDTIPGIHDFQSCALDQAQPSLHGVLLHLCYITTNDSKKQDIFSRSENIFEKPLAFSEKACIMISVRGALAQLVARNVRNVEVRSSNLLCSTRKGFVSANPFVLC